VLDYEQTRATWVAATPSLSVLRPDTGVYRAPVVGLCAGKVDVGRLSTLVEQSRPSSNTASHICGLVAILACEEGRSVRLLDKHRAGVLVLVEAPQRYCV
jgi:hypothetical protein